VRDQHRGGGELYFGTRACLQLGDGQTPDIRDDDVRKTRRRLDQAKEADELPARPFAQAAEGRDREQDADQVEE
jgi:hypothetical protein